MEKTVRSFQELTPELRARAGGKGGMLAKMFQSGYPVPEGFVILPSSFQEDNLSPEAWIEIQDYLGSLRKKGHSNLFAVRSSALSEDSAAASFAGEFETVLNRQSDEEIREAIDKVYRSRMSDRVSVYSAVQGIEAAHQIAVVVQRMVPSDYSGVVFTADPITGSRVWMIGNFVTGLGEKLVSGEADAESFRMNRPAGKYEGPQNVRKYASQLYKLAVKLEKELGGPLDIEWAVAHGRLYILQARPITTLQAGNLDTYEWNDSKNGDFLWTNTNVGEAIPDTVTPFTWSLLRKVDEKITTIPGYYLISGNICGKIYTNISLRMSILSAFGVEMNRGMRLLADTFGEMPKEINMPVYPFSRFGVLKTVLPRAKMVVKNLLKANKQMQPYLEETPQWCIWMTDKIQQVKTKEQLFALWNAELEPYYYKATYSLLAGAGKFVLASKLKKELTKLIGEEEATLLLSNLRGSAELASLGPVTGIAKIVRGEMSRGEYMLQYGHRGPHEFELSLPHPAEDSEWLEQQIMEFDQSGNDVEELLKKQQILHANAWQKFQKQYPSKARSLEKQLLKVSEYGRLRERVRSEYIRVHRVVRTFALQAAELTNTGDRIFFLYLDEVLRLLCGESSALNHIAARQATYQKYKELPPFPTVIRGRFDPNQWVENPNRRTDYYDPAIPVADSLSDIETLKGFPGAAGRVEGMVRVLRNPEEGDQLRQGEILVAYTTNVGWTPLFPRTAAVITDIGAPLSHAAIVARELGIPAVVGCGTATSRLKTGDRVIVDGAQGIVHILQ